MAEYDPHTEAMTDTHEGSTFEATSSRAKGGSHYLARFSLLFGSCLILALVASMLAGDLGNAWWHMGTLATAFGTLLIVRTFPRFSVVMGRTACLLAALILIGGTFMQALTNYETGVRPSLMFASSGTLGASIVTLLMCHLALARRPHALGLTILAVPAIALTGTKTAILAALVGLVSFACFSSMSRRRRMLWSATVIATVLLIVSAILWLPRTLGDRNQLLYSNTFEAYAWRAWPDTEVIISPRAADAPVPRRMATRIVAETSASSPLVLYHDAGVSKPNSQYVASVFVRGPAETRIVLSNHLSSTVCDVSTTWTRCATPPGVGDGRVHVQFRLETPRPNSRLDVLVWGAQLEENTAASPLEETGRLPMSRVLMERIMPTRTNWIQDTSRLYAWAVAAEMFSRRPLFGFGMGAFPHFYSSTEFANEVPGLQHAHNLILQLLAESGVFGLLAHVGPFVIVTALSWTSRWRSLLPLIVSLVVLNMLDISYFSSGVYYAVWLCLGVNLYSFQQEPHGQATK